MTTTTTLGWTRAGSGEPLLLLHGIGTTRADFAELFPRLAEDFDVLSLDLPGHGESAPLEKLPTVAALADAVETSLDSHELRRVHILGNSLGARLALELARRGRARSVLAISPSGLGLPAERLHQGLLMSTTRVVTRAIRPLIRPLSASGFGRAALLGGLRARPWEASKREALAMKAGFAESDDFWRMLWWSVLADVPVRLEEIDCPVVLAQGTLDLVGAGQTPRYLSVVPGSRFEPLVGAGHAPQSDSPTDIVRLVHEVARSAGNRPAPERVFGRQPGARSLKG